MNDLVMWPIAVQNPVTKEWLRCLGQGKTVADAIGDAIKNLQASYRPSSDGKIQPNLGIGVAPKCAVRLADGSTVNRKLADFESEKPYDTAEKQVLPECEIPEYLNRPRPQMDFDSQPVGAPSEVTKSPVHEEAEVKILAASCEAFDQTTPNLSAHREARATTRSANQGEASFVVSDPKRMKLAL